MRGALSSRWSSGAVSVSAMKRSPSSVSTGMLAGSGAKWPGGATTTISSLSYTEEMKPWSSSLLGMNANSTAPPSSSLSASPYVHSLMFTSTPGWSAEKRPSGPGRRIATMLTQPSSRALMRETRRQSAALASQRVRASGSRRSPSRVSESMGPWRSNRRTPQDCSRLATERLSVDCATPSSSAARDMLPSRAAASNARTF